MISIILAIKIIWMHFLIDFFCQTDKMALNKSKSFYWLGIHASIYSLPFFLISWKYAIINGILHFIIDGITSRIASYFWKNEKRRSFFNSIGIDQAIHLTCLFLTITL